MTIFKDVRVKEVLLSDIFDIIKRGKRLIEANRIDGDLPFITAGVVNQGISSYISNSNIEIFPANSLTIDMFGKVFYRDFEYGADDHIAVLACSDNYLSKEVLLFLATMIEKAIQNKFDYAQNFYASDVYEVSLTLPVTLDNDKIPDWDYMKTVVRSLAPKYLDRLREQGQSQINKIRDKQFGIAKMLGIDDFGLTDEEREVLSVSAVFKDFFMSEVFEFKETKAKINANTITNFNGSFPYVTRSDKNNGIQGYIDYPTNYLNPARTISLGMDTATFFYQREEYFTGDKVKILSLIDTEVDIDKIYHYLLVSIKKAFGSFGWGTDSYETDVLKSVKIKLPVQDKMDKKPDWKYMEKISEIMVKKSLEKYEQEIARHEQEIARHEQEIAHLISKFLEV